MGSYLITGKRTGKRLREIRALDLRKKAERGMGVDF